VTACVHVLLCRHSEQWSIKRNDSPTDEPIVSSPPCAQDGDGSAIGVESGIYDTLVIARKPVRLPNVDTVKGIESGFRGRANVSVPDEAIDATKTQVLRMRVGDPTEVDTDARHVSGARP
jgi:hypothetical protein